MDARGFEVSKFTDPSDVTSKISSNVEILLLDMKLKDVSSLEILNEIRNEYPKLQVILVTGYRQEMASSIEAALQISAYTCLYKPLQIDELIKVLSEVRKIGLAGVLGREIKKSVKDKQ